MADLIIRDLTLARGNRIVLGDASAVFASSSVTVLWGESGSGKSTLLTAIAGLFRPLRGAISIGTQTLFSAADGVDVPPHQRRIGFVFQDLALWPHLRAIEQVALVGKSDGLRREDAAQLLVSVGLNDHLDRHPGELSGGEQQRLAIARALAIRPRILLLDEPFSSLDRRTKKGLQALLRSLVPRIEGPVIYVTHDPAEARTLGDRVLALRDGALHEASVEELEE